jgi:putative MATE family efflux protein
VTAPAASPATELTPPTPWWRLIGEALRGGHHDYTDGPLGRAIVLLAVPMVLEMAMESVFALVDVLFVARLGAAAVASVGITEAFLALIYTVAMGVSIGVTAMVARRIGERRPEAAATVAVQAVALGLAFAAVLALPGVIFAPQLLALMGAGPDVVATGTGYTRMMLGGNAVIMLLFLLNAVFRGAGDAAYAMRVLWLANGINLVLDPCLIFGLGPFPELGVTGAAVATNIGRGVGVLGQLYLLGRGQGRVRVAQRQLRLEPEVMRGLLRLSGAGTFQVFVGTASWVGLIRVLADFGSAAVAGYTIGIRIILFALLPSWGLANAAATLVGQGLGAGRPDRAERAAWLAGGYNGIFLGVVGALFVALAPAIVGRFTSEADVTAFAVQCLRVISLGFVFYAFGMVLTQAFNGAGDTWTPTLINLACFWLGMIPLAWVLARRLALGPIGVFEAIAASYSLLAVVSAVLFRRGRWKLRQV